VIVSYRDKRTADFAGGKRIKAWSGIERSARLKLDRLEAAQSLVDLAALPGNRLESLEGRSQGTVQHPRQRSVADLFRMAR
jgi:proteic killer suppression protein